MVLERGAAGRDEGAVLDVTTAYLQDIGQERLLAAEEEIRHGREIETAQHLNAVAEETLAEMPAEDRTAAMAARLYARVHGTARALADSFPTPEALYAPEFRSRIDGALDGDLIAELARVTGASEEEAARQLVLLSRDMRLLTEEVARAAARVHPWDGPTPTEAELMRTLTPFTGTLSRHWGAVREEGERAEERMIRGNLRLVVSVARRYLDRGMAMLDLIQEGNGGLMQAVRRFDHRRGRRFSTYATWWIRQSILRALAERGRMIRMPVHRGEELARVERARQQWMSQYGDQPNAEEIAAQVEIPAAKVRQLLREGGTVLSLDFAEEETGSSNLGAMIADPEGDVEGLVVDGLLREELGRALDSLPPRERKLLEMHYGLNGHAPLNLAEVGRQLGISRERARQIEERALRLLRAWPTLGE